MNTFINFVKRSLAGGGTRGEVGALGEIGASLLPASDILGTPVSLSYSLGISAEIFTQGLHQIVQDPGAIVKNRGLNVIFPNGLADPLDIELLEL